MELSTDTKLLLSPSRDQAR
ncbi:hypothetical protein LSH36_186g03052 [Paralvinella palmiformis]|uniref:Uncharacterized protein n=1 Tax=Paralvinella palmiformis TaxID=53620 RepID=A0AAD9JT29_9ANNE|nr:hypothetical protein LSH36_186g03052 [Paralvinella palmiformis]